MDDLRSPVSRLPPELLIEIFEYLVTRSSPTILLKICHRWADIASSVPSLWAKIDFLTPPAPLLQRCANQPIEVVLPSSPFMPTWGQLVAAREVLFLCKDRIRKLALDLSEGDLQKIQPELSGVFPVLVDVSISVRDCDYRSRRPEDIPEWNPAATLPIRCLRLLFVKTPWIPGRFQNLAEFFLHEQLCPDFNPTMEEFLGILDSSPQLTVLSVANAGFWLPRNTTILPSATRVVHLHNLQRLYLKQDDPCNIGWMLIHLKIPASANVRIAVDLSSRLAPAPLRLVPDLALPDHPGLPHLASLRRCSYEPVSGSASIITATNFAFRVSWDYDIRKHFDSFMMPFFRRAAGVIEDLTIFHPGPTEYSTSGTLRWEQIFGTLPFLRKLRVVQPPDHLDNSMWILLGSPPVSGPALRDLWLSCLVLEKRGIKRKVLGRRLVDYCAELDRRGCRLERLVIETFYPPPDLGLSLAPFVDHFEIRKADPSYGYDILCSETRSRQLSEFPRACKLG